MAFSIEDIGEIDQVVGQWCLNRVPPHLKKSVDYDYEIDGQAVIIIEVRPAWQGCTRRSHAAAYGQISLRQSDRAMANLLDACKR
jgi:hypothetical protein